MTFPVGSLIKARGREWVILPDSTEDLLLVRPLGGSDEEVAGIYLPLEGSQVRSAEFGLPDPRQVGDQLSARLLRDAVRLGFRSSAGPFRSFARLGCEPRPYQLVPLLMALKLDPVRLLIADDVGIGKTIEACLIARELIDRGEAKRLAVLCPPHLAEQWQKELREKFHIEAELVLASTAARLERGLGFDQSLFDIYPYVIVSTDFIKSERRREDFSRACPELVIIDEAHTCAYGAERGGRHQRHALVSKLAANPSRHIILVTATPHSGDEGAFRSLLALLSPAFAELDEDLSSEQYRSQRRELARFFIQRRRGDIRHFLQAETPFPERDDGDAPYHLTPEYRALFERVLAYARETVRDRAGGPLRQRVRWWSALAMLRSLASSPAAAAATLRNRSITQDAGSLAELDQIGAHTVLDPLEDESAEGGDLPAGGAPDEEDEAGKRGRARLLELARQAERLMGAKDNKLLEVVQLVRQMLEDGYSPIIFCRYIPTAEYLAAELRQRLAPSKSVREQELEVAAVTGLLPPEEREERIRQISGSPRRVLVATDCLSEGINLQENFNAVIHYDLSWNPTRHEQRDGRVDRYGQPSPVVRIRTCYGIDNRIDATVLEVLIRKHRIIKTTLGIHIPVPVPHEEVVEAIFEGLLLHDAPSTAPALPGMEDYLRPKREELTRKWDAAAQREKRSHSLFAQETLRFDEVSKEMQAVRGALGAGADVASFTRLALAACKASVKGADPLEISLENAPESLRDALLNPGTGLDQSRFAARFEPPVRDGQTLLTRTHPFVERLAAFVLETALEPQLADRQDFTSARRCGAIYTRAVSTSTTLLLLRYRFDIFTPNAASLLAEDTGLLAFRGSPDQAEWLDDSATESLLQAESTRNILPENASRAIRRVVDSYAALLPHLAQAAQARAAQLLLAHQRVRQSARLRAGSLRVEPKLPIDILGIYVYLPG